MTQKQSQSTSQIKSVNNKIEIEKRVKQIIANHLEKEESNESLNDSFKDLDLDEFDITELVMKWEDAFGIIIEDSDIPILLCVRDVVAYILEK